MKLSRNMTIWMHYVFDELVPPAIRDCKWFMYIPFKILFKDKADVFFSFKDKAPYMSSSEYEKVYADVSDVVIERDTDLNRQSVDAVLNSVVGSRVLDVACGRGHLSKLLSSSHTVTGADIIIDPNLREIAPGIKFVETNLESLPFPDSSFDTVVCAHTLEHVQCPDDAIAELRRVTEKRLIVILPRQRPYRYTFDLHMHFFPYAHDVLSFMSASGHGGQCRDEGGDWFYVEDVH